ncbi:hypothetical protein [Planococcus chinensis]|uniref:Uncharacterized protein n=1 Tax=Planococcus chinensis TaxID=272917 RepID=A0ABW4QHI8_9BACL
MLSKIKIIASTAVLIGILLLLANLDDAYNLYNIPYFLIGGGIILLAVSLLVINKEKSWLCRIGWHRYEQVGREFDLPGLYLYRCERCQKEKKVVKAV